MPICETGLPLAVFLSFQKMWSSAAIDPTNHGLKLFRREKAHTSNEHFLLPWSLNNMAALQDLDVTLESINNLEGI